MVMCDIYSTVSLSALKSYGSSSKIATLGREARDTV